MLVSDSRPFSCCLSKIDSRYGRDASSLRWRVFSGNEEEGVCHSDTNSGYCGYRSGHQSLSQSAGVGWTCVEHSRVLGMRNLKGFRVKKCCWFGPFCFSNLFLL